MTHFDTILKATKASPKWSNRDILTFHFFNQFGLMQVKSRLDDQISDLVKQGKANTGAIIAYGTFNDFWYKKAQQLIEKKRVRNSDLNSIFDGMRHDIERAKEFIEQHK